MRDDEGDKVVRDLRPYPTGLRERLGFSLRFLLGISFHGGAPSSSLRVTRETGPRFSRCGGSLKRRRAVHRVDSLYSMSTPLGWTLALIRTTRRADETIVVEAHADDVAVDAMGIAVKEKLDRKRAAGSAGWEDPSLVSDGELSRLLREHVDKGDPVDVAALAAMLIARNATIAPGSASVRRSDDR